MKETNLSDEKRSEMVEYFSSCGIETHEDSVQLIGEGFFHRVFQVSQSDGTVRVLKIPTKPLLIGLAEDERNIELLKQYQGKFMAGNTEIYRSSDNRRYVVSSDFVDGRPLNTSDLVDRVGNLTAIGEQLHEIFQANFTMYEETGASSDFIALEGHKTVIEAKIKNTPVQLTNIFVTDEVEGDPQLRIIDTDIAYTRKQKGVIHQALHILGYEAQRYALRNHFYPLLRTSLRNNTQQCETEEYLIRESRRTFFEKIRAKFVITPDDLVDFVYPLAQYVHTVKPDYIIALDRGARLVGFTLHNLYRELYGSLPTKDHVIHFRRLSSKIPVEELNRRLKPDIDKFLEDASTPTILFIDDWTKTGRTLRRIKKAVADLSESGIHVLFGLMRGLGADVSGDKYSGALATWRNNDALTGVAYSTNSDEGYSLHSAQAKAVRRRIIGNIRYFVKRLSAPEE